MSNVVDIETFIRERLPVACAPGVPEIRLHRAGPASGLMRLGLDQPPYWAHAWGGGLALARHLLDHPEAVAGRSALDLGGGSGLVAIAAALAGAASVTAADISPEAAVAARMNAVLNGVTVDTVTDDLTAGPPPEAEVILVGDLFYDADLAERVGGFLDRCIAAGRAVIVGDPWRAPLPRGRLQVIAEHTAADFGAESTPAAVFAWVSAP